MTNINESIQQLPAYDERLTQLWQAEQSSFTHKIIVLDDDPTGVQTVHGVPVYTDWSLETIENAFNDQRQMAFILTNSRAFSVQKTTAIHQEIAERIALVAKQFNQSFLLISRGDSTLRGHYPLETEVLQQTIEQNSAMHFDGEIIIPFFKEGGRETFDDVHYVKQGDTYIPAGETEFAKDRMFGFTNSNLKDWVAEKTENKFNRESVLSIPLEDMRNLNIEAMKDKLLQLKDFQKLIVNAVSEDDLKAFSIALLQVLKGGKNYLYRTAASFTKVIGDISSKPYLTKEELIQPGHTNGGLIIVGSHVQKTTAQLNVLKELKTIDFIEFNCHLVKNNESFSEETTRIQTLIDDKIKNGKTVCVYTSRERLDLNNEDKEAELALSVKISNAVTAFVKNCQPTPKFVLAKGGITSSDIGTIGLSVKKAEVAGQIAPGIPVWQTDEHSKFPHLPYIIFPGNVGENDTLKKVIEKLQN